MDKFGDIEDFEGDLIPPDIGHHGPDALLVKFWVPWKAFRGLGYAALVISVIFTGAEYWASYQRLR